MSSSPAFQFYPDDFLGSGKVGMMTLAEIGAYVLLLCLDWNDSGFEYDVVRLARWCRCSPRDFRTLWPRLSACFVERDGRLYNPRLERERDKQAKWREKSAAGGRRSGEMRRKGGSAMVPGTSEPNNAPMAPPAANTPVSAHRSPDSSPSSIAGRNDLESEAFEIAWKEYPKRAGGNPKRAAAKAWQARIRAGVSADAMLAGLRRYRQWCKNNGKIGTQYVMQTATFFGPDGHFEEEYALSAEEARGELGQAAALLAMARSYGLFAFNGNTDEYAARIREALADPAARVLELTVDDIYALDLTRGVTELGSDAFIVRELARRMAPLRAGGAA